MASVIQIGGKWRAQVRRSGERAQCKTFLTKAAAEAWARAREVDIDKGLSTGRIDCTIGEVFAAYRGERAKSARPIKDKSNEFYQLRKLEKTLGHHKVSKLQTTDLIGFAMQRRDEGAIAWTVNQDVTKLGTVLKYGAGALNTAFPDIVGPARARLTYLGLIGPGGRRDRRPTPGELAAVLRYFAEHKGRKFGDGARRAAAVEVASISAMRIGEICALRWSDIDESKRIAVCMRKHPRLGKTRELVPLLPRAWDIIQAQPRDCDRPFPFLAGTMSTDFTQAVRALGFSDLKLHDLRHEAASALFEQGYDIPHVALVTGHKTWAMLKRYTNLAPESMSAPGAAPPAQPGARAKPAPRVKRVPTPRSA